MEENKPEKKQLSPQELQKRKKLIVFPLMIIAFIGCMWLIFAPSKEAKQQSDNNFNTDIPLPQEENIIGDKKTAYETEQMRVRQEEKMRTLQDFSFILGDSDPQKDELNLIEEDVKTSDESSNLNFYGNSTQKVSTVQSSALAYQDINRQLGSFYQTPRKDPEKEELAKKIEELTSRLESQENMRFSANDQLALLEKSYELASKYSNNGNQEPVQQIAPMVTSSKPQAMPVKTVSERIVSGLQTEMTNDELVDFYNQSRNFGFNTAVSEQQYWDKNTIKACIHEDQAVMDGQNVRLRLLEALQVGNVVVPVNTLFSGTARVQGERLDILINTLEYHGNIIPVELSVYDSDGQKGLSIPSSLEMQALNEAMANVGSRMGTNFTVNQNAGAAIVNDVTQSILQGGSQYLSKKFRTVKVNLKANHQVMLYNKQ